MRSVACVLLCLVALSAQTLAQFGFNPNQPNNPNNPNNPINPNQPGRPNNPGGPGQPFGPGGGFPHNHPNHPHGGNPALPPMGPGQDPNRKEICAKFWMEENGSCYLYDSGAFLRRAGAFNPTIMNQDGLFQAAANMYCGSLIPGATLVTINNKVENDFVYEWVLRMMPEPQQVWIGLRANMTAFPPQWSWFSGEPVTYTNWEHGQMVQPEFGLGAMLFDADPLIQLNNQVDVTAQWVPEGTMNERHPFICEYHPAGIQAGTMAPPTTFRPAGRPTGRPPVTRPVMMNNPSNLNDFLGGTRFGGSRLHEMPRQRSRPANYRMNRYYGVMP